MINEERLTKALRYLAETDEPCATAKADMERAKFRAEAVRDAVFTRLDGSVADRAAQAKGSGEYAEAMNAYFTLLAEFEAMRNKRSTESIVVDVWRSLNASRRVGNV